MRAISSPSSGRRLRRFRGACCLRHQGDEGDLITLIALMMEAASTSEMSKTFYQTIRRNNPEEAIFTDEIFAMSNQIFVM
jgi:hypothetical protein